MIPTTEIMIYVEAIIAISLCLLVLLRCFSVIGGNGVRGFPTFLIVLVVDTLVAVYKLLGRESRFGNPFSSNAGSVYLGRIDMVKMALGVEKEVGTKYLTDIDFKTGSG